MTDRVSDGIEWLDPGKPHAGKQKWEGRLAPLMRRGGEWACLGLHHEVVVNNLNRGHYVLPAGTQPSDWEFTARVTHPITGERGTGRKRWLFVRYVGVAA